MPVYLLLEVSDPDLVGPAVDRVLGSGCVREIARNADLATLLNDVEKTAVIAELRKWNAPRHERPMRPLTGTEALEKAVDEMRRMVRVVLAAQQPPAPAPPPDDAKPDAVVDDDDDGDDTDTLPASAE